MKPISIFALMLLACFPLSAAHAAASTIDAEFTELHALSAQAVTAGQAGDASAFLEAAHAALKQAKLQMEKKSSATLQRIIPNLKSAVHNGEAGNLAAGTQAIEAAMAKMGQRPAPRFGGGSE